MNSEIPCLIMLIKISMSLDMVRYLPNLMSMLAHQVRMTTLMMVILDTEKEV